MDVHSKILGRTGDKLAVLLKMGGTGGLFLSYGKFQWNLEMYI